MREAELRTISSNADDAGSNSVKCRVRDQDVDCDFDEETQDFYCEDPLLGEEAQQRQLSRFETTLKQALGEALGTFVLVTVGLSAVATDVTKGALGLPGVAAVFGLGVTLAIFLSADLSGAHLNPAVSLAMAVLRPREFPRRRLLPYVCAQLLGAAAGGCVVYAVFAPVIRAFEADADIVRGDARSSLSGMILVEYFPNPAAYGTGLAAANVLGAGHAVLVEAVGTAVLSSVIFCLTSARHKGLPAGAVPVLVGLTVSCCIAACATQTQASFNPARDLGPRVVAAIAGWGSMALPGPRGGWWVYWVGPCVGALVGGWVHERVVGPWGAVSGGGSGGSGDTGRRSA